MTYAYNLDGSIGAITYPSGDVFSYINSAVSRQLSVSDTTQGVNYITNAHYAPQGALASMTGGANLFSTYIYNSRLQSCWIYTTTATALPWNTTTCTTTTTAGNILDLKYNFNAGTSDNGNVVGITNNLDATRSQNFTYDALNRITAAETTSTFATSPTHCWGETYQYDNQSTTGAWGNLTGIVAASSPYTGCTQESGLSVTVTANNQFSSTNGYGYDAAGNMTSTPPPTSAVYTYDAENHLIAAGGVTYTYDGDGKRVQKSTGKLYWYDISGNVISELSASGVVTDSYVFFAGHRVEHRSSTAGIFYLFADHLGTPRAIVAAGQTVNCYDADFYPYGGERTYVNSCGENYKFTGKERDAESDLDNFAARFSGSNFGRFMSPDPDNLGAAVEAPQSWNGYSYVLNSPLNAVDPSGTDCIYIDNDTGKYLGFDRGDCDNSTDEKANTGYYVNGTVSTITTTTGDTDGVVTAYSATNYDTASPTLLSGTFGPAPSNVSAPTTMPKPSLAGAAAGPVIVCELAEPCGAVLDTIVIGAAAITGAVLVGKGAYNYLSKGGTQNIVPSWAEGERPLPGESGRDFAKRLCDARYGPGNYPTGPGSEYNKLKKWGNDNRS